MSNGQTKSSVALRVYEQIREQIASGDVVAFSSPGIVSGGIRSVTKSVVNHVGVVVTISTGGAERKLIFEPIVGKAMQISALSKRLEETNGKAWWLKLSEENRQKLSANAKSFYDFVFDNANTPYDTKQAVSSAYDEGFFKFTNDEDLSKLFCSEFVTASMEKAGIFKSINASEFTPSDICSCMIFENYIQLKGKTLKIEEFNSKIPAEIN